MNEFIKIYPKKKEAHKNIHIFNGEKYPYSIGISESLGSYPIHILEEWNGDKLDTILYVNGMKYGIIIPEDIAKQLRKQIEESERNDR